MPDPGDERCLPALAAALRSLLLPGAGAAERALSAFAEPQGLDFAAFLEPSGLGFAPRGVWMRERGAPRGDELRLPPRWLEAFAEGRVVSAPAGEVSPPELKPLRLFGAPALLAAPARGDGLVGVLLFAAFGQRFTWSEGHAHAASALAAALAAALVRIDETAAVLDHLPQRIAWKDSRLRYRGANRAFARAAGLTGAQLAGRSDRELVLRPELCDGGDVARRHEREVLQSGRPQLARIEATQVAAGREQWLAVSRIPLTGGDGKPSGVIVVSEDITDRLQAAAMLRHAERTGAVARLASAMSADLQNPLTEIENLATDERIRSAARNANDLVRQLAAFARRQLADPIDVAPASLIARMGGLLGRVLGDGLALELPVEGLRSAVRVDPRQLELLVVAVVRHIRSYMPQGAKLAIDVALQTLGIERSLGFGLPAGEYVRIRFLAYPVESGGADMGEALRARLALAQAIARHGGGALRLNRDSESSFRASFDSLAIEVVLPRVFSIPRAVDPTPTSDTRGVESVLILDDDLHLRGAVAAALRQLGYTVHIAEHLDEALALQRQTRPPPALALISSELSAGTAEAARALQKAQPELRVLVLSRHAGGEGVVVSGSFEALAARVRQALDTRPG
ncbi:PAS domain-containing protein [Nannocystis pusilla]|uniref:PAS domain-containing protein n=1 Tax=Nannocystis pusilla TaxID=889268 RepID=A0A9X3EKF8_9BACT|nr:PAS domain-containing sensor histidine kinase [Nannocystis pusilla]MCY1004854.1 PAS domain-containing protein [Nannocystis pusilla]